MIFRAIFWIGLVAVLMPHEPDLGFGRPDAAGGDVAGEVTDWAKTKVGANIADPKGLCRYNADACATGVSLLDDFRNATRRSLAEVRQDIRQNGRRR
jgi:hypothetical protein